MVYFISDGHGHIKIGITSNINERIKALQTGNPYPLTVRKAITTLKYPDCDLEKWLHHYFSESNCKTTSLTSEWFHEDEKINDFLNLSNDEISCFIYRNIEAVTKIEIINYETIGGLNLQISRMKKTIDSLKQENEYLTTLLHLKEKTL